jgi:hypothetical protein
MALGDPTTRRAVAKTGVKLAYTVPLVAASFRLVAVGAAAYVCDRSCGGSPPDPGCWERHGVDCAGGTAIRCTDPGGCTLIETVEGDICCSGVQCGVPCDSSAECHAVWPGSLCQAANTGCCGQVCIPPCGGTFGNSSEVNLPTFG